MAGGNDSGIEEIKRMVHGLLIDCFHAGMSVPIGASEVREIDHRVAATRLHVAVRAVGMQVGTSPCIQVLSTVVGVYKMVGGCRGLQQKGRALL